MSFNASGLATEAVTIEVFKPQYTNSIGSLISSIQREEFAIPISLEQQPDLYNIAEFYQKDKGNFWVALHGQQVIGTISLLDIGSDQAALRKMFVHSNFRGSKFGVAKRLLDTALNDGSENGLKQIYLGTTAQFLAAHRFYEKNGFIKINKADLPTNFPVMSVDSKFYKIFI